MSFLLSHQTCSHQYLLSMFCLLYFVLFFNVSLPFLSILGMHLFGGEFCTIEAFNLRSRTDFQLKCRCCLCNEYSQLINQTDFRDLECTQPRKNFDSLTTATLTVFQVDIRMMSIPKCTSNDKHTRLNIEIC